MKEMLIPGWLVRAVVTGGLSGSSAAFQGCSNYWRTLEQPTRAQPGPAQPGQADTEIWKYRKMTNCPTEQRNVSNVSTPLPPFPHPRNEYSKVQPLECRPTPLSSPRQEQKCFYYCKHFLIKFSDVVVSWYFNGKSILQFPEAWYLPSPLPECCLLSHCHQRDVLSWSPSVLPW